MKDRVPNAFSKDKKARGQYVLLKTIGVRALNRIANDLFNYWRDDRGNLRDLSTSWNTLGALDWTKDSQISAYGGQKGVKLAHKDLLQALAGAEPEYANKALLNHGWAFQAAA